MNQLYQNYTACCGGNHRTIKINPNSTDDEIRRYMFGEHNEKTIKLFGGKPSLQLAIPYYTDDKTPIEILSINPDLLPKINYSIITPKGLVYLRNTMSIILPKRLEEIVVTHNGLPVDTMSKEELSKYETTTNYQLPTTNHFGLRQSVA